jgi:hypothetical protein
MANSDGLMRKRKREFQKIILEIKLPNKFKNRHQNFLIHQERKQKSVSTFKKCQN